VLCFHLRGLELGLGRISPPKPPVATELVLALLVLDVDGEVGLKNVHLRKPNEFDRLISLFRYRWVSYTKLFAPNLPYMLE